jgi:hypothetical protein
MQYYNFSLWRLVLINKHVGTSSLTIKTAPLSVNKRGELTTSAT